MRSSPGPSTCRFDQVMQVRDLKGRSDGASGVVFDIKKYGVHDGPGIRSVVFLKGCPLRCLWCDNPESQSVDPQVAYFPDRCAHCDRCAEVCSSRAIPFEGNRSGDSMASKVPDQQRCTACGRCVDECWRGARQLIGTVRSVQDVYAEVSRDRKLYSRSGGGVTLSGGEPLLQAQFTVALLKLFKEKYLTTAIETTGYARWDVVKSASEYANVFLFDLKHIDDAEHRRLTGVSNEPILENLARLAREGAKVVVRFPMISGCNDSRGHVERLASHVARLPGVEELHLLPYHRLGEPKYERIGCRYEMADVGPPSDDHVQEIKTIIEAYGLRVQVGG